MLPSCPSSTMWFILIEAQASCYTAQSEEAGTVDELEEGWRQECVASNLVKCSLNGEEEIRMPLIDFDL